MKRCGVNRIVLTSITYNKSYHLRGRTYIISYYQHRNQQMMTNRQVITRSGNIFHRKYATFPIHTHSWPDFNFLLCSDLTRKTIRQERQSDSYLLTLDTSSEPYEQHWSWASIRHSTGFVNRQIYEYSSQHQPLHITNTMKALIS